MDTLVHEAVKTAKEGTNPTCVCKVPSGWILIGFSQYLRGYSLLMADPVVFDLNSLGDSQRYQFLRDMATLGDAILEVTDAYRINYEILGNSEQALHAHVFPRYMSESESFRKGPVWLYPEKLRNSIQFDIERDKNLVKELAIAIKRHYC